MSQFHLFKASRILVFILLLVGAIDPVLVQPFKDGMQVEPGGNSKEELYMDSDLQSSSEEAHRRAGFISCGQFIEWRKSDLDDLTNIIVAWTHGFIYGVYLATEKSVDIPDRPSILAFYDKYCRNNPLADMREGAISLIGKINWRQSFEGN